MTKTCSQCGAVLPSGVRACNFCDTSFPADFSPTESRTNIRTQANVDLCENRRVQTHSSDDSGNLALEQNAQWRGELGERLEAYRSRRRKGPSNAAQSHLPFEEAPAKRLPGSAVAVAETSTSEDDFSFTIAIGRSAKKKEFDNSRMVIDVTHPCESFLPDSHETPAEINEEPEGLYPTASIEERRLAGIVDALCLLFAYGGFLMLFGSLGGEFTLSKLSAAVYGTTFAFVYLQYFALFTIFGGTTPGMMMRGLQVASFSGETPTPRQLLLRSTGYMLSAGTFFLGYLWSMWDEDSLTWHDRLSRTYLTSAQTLADIEATNAAPTR